MSHFHLIPRFCWGGSWVGELSETCSRDWYYCIITEVAEADMFTHWPLPWGLIFLLSLFCSYPWFIKTVWCETRRFSLTQDISSHCRAWNFFYGWWLEVHRGSATFRSCTSHVPAYNRGFESKLNQQLTLQSARR